MNVDALCAAVWEADDWLKRFNRADYEEAFHRYQERFAPLYARAVREAEDVEGLQKLADAVLDALERNWNKRLLGRGARMVDERQVVVCFLSPMLLEEPDPLCARFAGVLRQSWADRWPKQAYYITTYEVLRTGFRTAFMGIDLTGSCFDPNRDTAGKKKKR